LLLGTAVLALVACDGPFIPSGPVASVSVGGGSTVLVGAALQLTATTLNVLGYVLTGYPVTWSSSDTARATVSETGLVTGVSLGDVVITAISDGQSGYRTLTVRAIPAAPVGVSTVEGSNTIILLWPIVPGATSYNVYWGMTPGLTPQNGTKVAGITLSSCCGFTVQFVHSGLIGNTTYYYVVTGANDLGEGAASATMQATASGDIGLTICRPIAGSVAVGQLGIGVRLTSNNPMASVTATVNGRSADLLFNPNSTACNTAGGFPEPFWVGTISLAGMPTGPLTLIVSAADVPGNLAGASAEFVHQ
jgi:hypothetical protein